MQFPDKIKEAKAEAKRFLKRVAVQEAVDYLEVDLHHIQATGDAVSFINRIRTLLSFVRAAQGRCVEPTSEDVRMSIDYLSKGWGDGSEASRFKAHVDTLIRAAQSPRLDGERLEAVNKAWESLEGDGRVEADWLWDAFPELGEG